MKPIKIEVSGPDVGWVVVDWAPDRVLAARRANALVLGLPDTWKIRARASGYGGLVEYPTTSGRAAAWEVDNDLSQVRDHVSVAIAIELRKIQSDNRARKEWGR